MKIFYTQASNVAMAFSRSGQLVHVPFWWVILTNSILLLVPSRLESKTESKTLSWEGQSLKFFFYKEGGGYVEYSARYLGDF